MYLVLLMVFCLLYMTGRDLQRMSGNSTSKVGFFSRKEIEELDASYQFPLNIQKQDVPTIEDALSLVSNSVRVVILDAKVGPPLYEKRLAEDIISVVRKTNCKNCIVWAKSDNLARDLIKASQDILVGYIVMNDPSAGGKSKLLRMKGASVVGVYHPLIDEKLVGTLRRRNKKVYAWTVDDEESMRRMLCERVDAIVTGKPSYLRVLMENIKTECMEEGFTVL